MKKLSLVTVLILSTVLLFAGGSEDQADSRDNSLQYIIDNGILVLGLDDNFPPMGFQDEAGRVVGFDIDLAREVCLRLGVELKIQPIDWGTMIPDLNSKDIDVIWNGLTINAERKEEIYFSKPYITNRQIIIVQAESGIDTKADLAEKTIGLQMGSSADKAVASDYAIMDSFSELAKYQNNVQAMMDLEIGRLDAVVVDEILGRYYISRKPGVFAIATESFAKEDYGIGFRKGEYAFAAAVDAALDEMVADGTAAVISSKWFGEDILLPR